MTSAQGTVCLTFDFDAISIWIGPHASKSPSMISRGEFGAVAVERILRLLDREAIPATFFMSGKWMTKHDPQVRALLQIPFFEVGTHGEVHAHLPLLSADEQKDEVDLGVYLSQIASAVMSSHAVEGIRLDMKVDTYPVSINVAMPTGLVVNELLTNALKHAFRGRDGGTITLHSISDGEGCFSAAYLACNSRYWALGRAAVNTW